MGAWPCGSQCRATCSGLMGQCAGAQLLPSSEAEKRVWSRQTKRHGHCHSAPSPTPQEAVRFIHSDASQTSVHTFHFTVFNFTTKPACTDVRLINFSLHIPPGALKDTSGSYYSQFLQSKPLFIHRHWPLRDKPGLQGQGTCGHLLINNTFRLQFCVHNVPITSWEKYVTREQT